MHHCCFVNLIIVGAVRASFIAVPNNVRIMFYLLGLVVEVNAVVVVATVEQLPSFLLTWVVAYASRTIPEKAITVITTITTTLPVFITAVLTPFLLLIKFGGVDLLLATTTAAAVVVFIHKCIRVQASR